MRKLLILLLLSGCSSAFQTSIRSLDRRLIVNEQNIRILRRKITISENKIWFQRRFIDRLNNRIYNKGQELKLHLIELENK